MKVQLNILPPDFLLSCPRISSTLHAGYVHNSLALPCLAAACQGVDGVCTVIREFTVNEPLDRVLRTLLNEERTRLQFPVAVDPWKKPRKLFNEEGW